MTAEASPSTEVHYIRSRISNACDGCKARKVKCDGKLPCSYCARRQRPGSCHYSPQRQRQRRSRGNETRRGSTPPAQRHISHRRRSLSPRVSRDEDRHGGNERNERSVLMNAASAAARPITGTNTPATTHFTPGPVETSAQPVRQALDASAEDDTEVPREARLLCDAQGKLIFIGDCAPLSLFQSVRQIVTTRVAHDAFAPQTSRYSVLENAPVGRRRALFHQQVGPPEVRPADVHSAVAAYLTATTGLVDLFDNAKLVDDLLLWANLSRKPDDATSMVNYLVLAIGRHMDDEELSQTYFEYACDRAYADLSGNLSVGTVQVYTLITMYMLCSCQINGAFLYFGIGVRAAYTVGLHRTEVNARFGADLHRQRDRLWKSLRIVDLFLSTSMGRPPATSDVDCTVPYGDNGSGSNGNTPALDLLDASVQILLIIEGIVVQIYSRKKISLQLTEGVSLQLRDWSVRWLAPLKDALDGPGRSEAQVSGACQVLSSYYYAVMLVSRPFLMYELCRRLSDGPTTAAAAAGSGATAGRAGLPSGKSKLADACIDAASLMVDPILDLIDRGVLNGRVPMLVSWLFASSLVLGVGLLGGFGRILEKYTRLSIRGLDHFAKNDTHATQYSLIAQSLLTTALEYLERREMQERMRRTESSSQLFGLIPHETRAGGTSSPARHHRNGTIGSQGASPATTSTATPRTRDMLDRAFLQQNHLGPHGTTSPPRLGDIDTAFLGLTESLLQTPDANYWNGNFGTEGDMGSALNLFPLLDAGGGIDLAHYLGSSAPP